MSSTFSKAQSSLSLVLKISNSPIVSCPLLLKYKVTPSTLINGASSSYFVFIVLPRLVARLHLPLGNFKTLYKSFPPNPPGLSLEKIIQFPSGLKQALTSLYSVLICGPNFSGLVQPLVVASVLYKSPLKPSVLVLYIIICCASADKATQASCVLLFIGEPIFSAFVHSPFLL